MDLATQAFIDLLWESFEQDFIAPARDDPRSEEACETLLFTISGLPAKSWLYGFHGPSWVLRRSGDGEWAADLYLRLQEAWRPSKPSAAWKRLVNEVTAFHGGESEKRYISWSLHNLFNDDSEGAQDRANMADALARRAKGEPIAPSGHWLGQQEYQAEPERRQRLEALYRDIVKRGKSPELFEAFLGTFADRIIATKALDVLRRGTDFKLTMQACVDMVREPLLKRELVYGG